MTDAQVLAIMAAILTAGRRSAGEEPTTYAWRDAVDEAGELLALAKAAAK